MSVAQVSSVVLVTFKMTGDSDDTSIWLGSNPFSVDLISTICGDLTSAAELKLPVKTRALINKNDFIKFLSKKFCNISKIKIPIQKHFSLYNKSSYSFFFLEYKRLVSSDLHPHTSIYVGVSYFVTNKM